MKVLFAASEAYPFAMSGGLADVAGALPKALRNRHVGCRVVMPLYDTVPEELRHDMKFLKSITVPVSWRNQYCGIFEAKIGKVIYYLLDNEYYFKRGSLYGFYDDAERFTFFSRAVLEMLRHIDFKPDIIHCNDWQTAMVPVYQTVYYGKDPFYSGIKTLFTIHNIQYQGKYGMELMDDVLGLPDDAAHLVEYEGCVNLMKGAIECADSVSTVSPNYANEILTPWYSHGLDQILSARSWKLNGIINGIDTDVYNPETDPHIAEHYSADKIYKKLIDKEALIKEVGLPFNENVPVIGIVSRLVSHKGIDLVKRVFEDMLQNNVQFVIVGSGEYEYEQFFYNCAARFPDKVAFRCGFIPSLAHKVYAGADMFLMPSQSEPCGLSQLVALRYGAIPIVRETGGLSDTISDSGMGKGNGFTFKNYNAHEMAHAVWRAVRGFADHEGWDILVKRAMECDNSWDNSANEYIKLYKNMLGQ